MNNVVAADSEIAIPQLEATTGLPCLKSWPATYAFAMVTFVLWIALLVALTECFS